MQQHPRLTKSAMQLFVIFFMSLYVINVGYGFENTCQPLCQFRFVSKFFGGKPANGATVFTDGNSGNRFAGTYLGYLVIPVPANYLRGIDEQRRNFEECFPSYLAGIWHSAQQGGWWYYYLYALAVKVPLGIWDLVLWALVLTLWRVSATAVWFDELAVYLPAAALLLFVSSQTGFSCHMRYVLPFFPFVVIGTTKLAFYLRPKYWKRGTLVAVCLLWGISNSIAVYPHSLSYFNEAAGGPTNGHAHLLDSNIDWGQDLLFLRDWVKNHPDATPLGLAYFNAVDPRIVGVEFALPCPGKPTSEAGLERAELEHFGPRAGYFAVSVNILRGMPFRVPDGHGGWQPVSPEDYSYFRYFQPAARAGYSIYIYHITPEQANTIRLQMGLPTITRSTTEGT